ncbi:c-type cytochrome [Myroides indicus]|uniref:Cytochrome c n=1 Tax=Myroides indicus TaxID=1323422 RepID=A0A4R7EUM7_9FLAO|nr:c-type cytochrome [Myroides indicus]TDS54649.1 cytochrome c [Myroides indicus]
MKKNISIAFLIFFLLNLVVSCGKKDNRSTSSHEGLAVEMTSLEKIRLGESLFKGKGNCASCHLKDKKVIGPSVREIIEIYDKHEVSIVSFLKGEGEPVVDPSQFIIMQANLTITKKMSDLELESLEAYMRSL